MEYYLAHPERYKGLSRWEVCKIDSGIHRKLLREGTMEEAIPERRDREGAGRPALSKEKIERIVTLYPVCKGNASEIARRGNWSLSVTYKYLKLSGLKIRKRGKPKKHK